MTMQFNPNKPALTKKYLWATFLPSRNPEFKLHAQENYAKSAFSYRNDGILYMWNSQTEQWDEVFRLENGQYETCEHGGSLVQNKWDKKPYHQYKRWIGRGMDSKKIAVCRDCDRAPRSGIVTKREADSWGDGE
jgi:hypothetical protein